jgi:hypothetical protein
VGAPGFNPATLAPGCGHTPEPLTAAVAPAHRARAAVAPAAWAGGARTGGPAVHALAVSGSGAGAGANGDVHHQLLRVTTVGPPAGLA